MGRKAWPAGPVALALAGCGGGSSGQGAASPLLTRLSVKTRAGKALFFDSSLSASGQQSDGRASSLAVQTVEFDANVNLGEIPYTPPTFAGGHAPTLGASEIDDVVAFLCTLTDGYDPNNPAAYQGPAQCLPGAP